MAANLTDVVFNLKGQTELTERGQNIWNTSKVEMKFSFEREWIKKEKPPYKNAVLDSLV